MNRTDFQKIAFERWLHGQSLSSIGREFDRTAARVHQQIRIRAEQMTPPMEWIGTEDQLPERNKQVWCYDEKEGVATGFRSTVSWWRDGEYTLDNVTHWQPLPKPEPPK